MDEDQLEIFRKSQELGDDIMPNLTSEALLDAAIVGDGENKNPSPIPSPSWLIKGPGKER